MLKTSFYLTRYIHNHNSRINKDAYLQMNFIGNVDFLFLVLWGP